MTFTSVVLGIALILTWVVTIVRRRRSIQFSRDVALKIERFVAGGGLRPEHVVEENQASFASVTEVLNDAMQHLSDNIRALSEERDVLNHILQSMTTGVISVTSAGRIDRMNNAAQRMFRQMDEESWKGSEHWAALHHYELGAAIDNALLFGRSWTGEIAFDNDTVINVQVIPMSLDDGYTTHRRQYSTLLLCNDVTEWRRLEQMRADFVGNVSHELKTPITAIQGFAETILDGSVDAVLQQEFVQVIHTEAVRMKNLVNDLLTLTRLQNGHANSTEFAEVALAELVEQSLSITRGLTHGTGIVLRADIPDETLVWAREDQLKQVLLNLLSNAVHYTPSDGTITVWAEHFVDRVKVHVADTGVGIAREHHRRLFERFYRVDRDRSRATGGTGLGLAIVKHIVQTHGGTVGVDSQPGLGSDFWFTIPTPSSARTVKP